MMALFFYFLPWLLLLLSLATIVFVIKRKWKVAVLFAAIVVMMNWWAGCFCLGLKNGGSGDLKVISFNVNGVGEYDEGKIKRVLSIIRDEALDVLYLTENFSPFGDSLHMRLQQIFPFNTRDNSPHNVIYSKKRIKESRMLETVEEGSSAYIVRARISLVNNDVIVYGTHLSSNNYSKNMDYLTPGEVNSYKRIRKYLDNIISSSELRALEATSIINSFSGFPRVVVMGDFNDVCGSKTLNTFSKVGLKDAWKEGGFGYGATIHHPLPYRIDHIMYNSGLKLKGVNKIDAGGISDHDALVAVFDVDEK